MLRTHRVLCHFQKWLLHAGAISRFLTICCQSFDFVEPAQSFRRLGLVDHKAGIGIGADKHDRVEKNRRERRERIVHGFDFGHLFFLPCLFVYFLLEMYIL